MLRYLSGSKAAPVLVLALVLSLSILGGAVLAGHRHLQRVVRAHLVNRDGEILDAVAQARQFNGSSTNLAERLGSPAEQLALALEISKFKDEISKVNDEIFNVKGGVVGVRLFGADGRFVTAVPAELTEGVLDPSVLTTLGALRPASRLHSAVDLQDLFMNAPSSPDATANTLPILEVDIPIHARDQGKLLACVQLLVNGRNLMLNAAAVDRQLRWEAWGVFLCGGALLTGILVWAYQRIERTNRLLQERTERLLRANHELTLAAKTGALGAVTAHLVHGLSNPLASLQLFMSAHGEEHPDDVEWQSALAATQRMRKMIHEVVRVLGEQNTREMYEINLDELIKVLDAKVRPAALASGARWEVQLDAEGRLSNHQANIVLLILENLISNALQVTPKGKAVRASVREQSEGVVCEVADEGPGIPESVLKNLFVPCRSTKGGSGLGLAISKQLASHLEAKLELKHNGPQGCAMSLILPRTLFSTSALDASSATVAA